MADDGAIIKAAFPRWPDDPYHGHAVLAMLRLLHASEAVHRDLDHLEDAMAFFIDDPPLSLQYKSPAIQAQRVADRLQALASEVRKSVVELHSLEPYAAQFEGEEDKAGVP